VKVPLPRSANTYSSVLCHWKKRHSQGKFNNEPAEEGLKYGIKKLERLVGKLTLENELLKRGLQSSLESRFQITEYPPTIQAQILLTGHINALPVHQLADVLTM